MIFLHYYYYCFSGKIKLSFHVNHLLGRYLHDLPSLIFLWKKKKKRIKISAAVVISTLRVKKRVGDQLRLTELSVRERF